MIPYDRRICCCMNPNQDDGPRGKTAEGKPRKLNALPLQTREYPAALPSIRNVMQRFNRNTMWVATGLLGTMIFAALVLAAQEHHSIPADVAEKEMPTSGEILLNANPVALSEGIGLSGKSTGEITSGQTIDVKANGNSWSPAQRQESARVIRPKILNVRYRLSMRPRFVDVKTRLLALWHQSLARSEKSRTWTLFSNSNKERKKKVSFTGETIH